jgi:hypothetical protein
MVRSTAPISPGAPAETTSSGQAQPPLAEVGQEAGPGVPGLGRGGVEPDEHRLAVGVDAPRGWHRLGGGVRVVLEVAAVQEQVVQLHVV